MNYLNKAQFLLQHERYEEAEKEIRLALADNPNNATALSMMAICKMNAKDKEAAVDFARKAVSNEPDVPYFYWILGHAYFSNREIRNAREAAAEGLRLDPNMPAFFELIATIDFYEDKWEDALISAEKGLELDPEDVDLINLRARALVQLNRREEADLTADYALHNAPENSFSHANKGWIAIERDNYDEAIRHFKEALRLDPNNAFAKSGLKEAIKGKNFLYRGLLKYFLWMNKMQAKNQWAFIIGIYIAYRITLKLAESVPALAPILYPLVVFYIIFAFSTWIAAPVSNLFLRLHPLGKYALTDDEKVASNITGVLAVGSLICFAAYFGLGHIFYFVLGGYLMLMMIPIGGTFAVPKESKGRKYLMYYTLFLASIGIIWMIAPQFQWLVIVFALGIFAYGFVANYLMQLAAKE